MKYWLMKTEPSTYSFDDLIKEKEDHWDGVRNYQARNNMKLMKKGDHVLIYHSVKDKEVVGVAEVTKEAYPDPTVNDPRWVAVNIKPLEKLKTPVSLAMIKDTPALAEMALIKQSRLSVMPLKAAEYKKILQMGS